MSHSSRRGFTLTELMVVIGIMGILSLIVITSQSSFNNSLVLSNSAYDIALALRDAQTYGLGGRAASGGSFSGGYGVHFIVGSSVFTQFNDSFPDVSLTTSAMCHGASSGNPDALPGNCVYDQGKDTNSTDFKLGNGITISDFCVYTSGPGTCALSSPPGPLPHSIDIVFARPDPLPFVSTDGIWGSGHPEACITISTPQGSKNWIKVSGAGEITVRTTPCP